MRASGDVYSSQALLGEERECQLLGLPADIGGKFRCRIMQALRGIFEPYTTGNPEQERHGQRGLCHSVLVEDVKTNIGDVLLEVCLSAVAGGTARLGNTSASFLGK